MIKERKHAIVLGGSRGVGSAIAAGLQDAGLAVVATSKKDLDTSDPESVLAFAKKNATTDVLVLNTGGPPKKEFGDITLDDWGKYHRQLFVGFALLLQHVSVRDGGYIFLISSHHIKEPNDDMILSHAYRLASWSMLKGLSKRFAERSVSCINLPLGPVLTDRLRNLVPDVPALESSLPLRRAGDPQEISAFVRSIVENDIKYLNGVSINFDGGLSHGIF